MKIDANELNAVSASQSNHSMQSGHVPPRMDMYALIHKALRAQMADALLALGRMDGDDADNVAATVQRVTALMDVCASHVRHEETFVHPAIEARARGASDAVAHDHQEHLLEIERIGSAASALPAADPAQRSTMALALYRRLSLFVAHNFEHMHVEETAHNAVLWSRYTDAELMVIHDELVASIPPEEMMRTIRWMIPSMTPAERAMVMGDMRKNAPAPVFDAAMDIVRPHLSTSDWAKLTRSLGLPPVPGLVG